MRTWIIAGLALVAWVTAWWWGLRWTQQNAAGAREGHAANEIGKRGRTEPVILDVMKRYPRSATPAYAWVDIAGRDENWEEALRRAQIVNGMFPRNPETTFRLAKALLMLERYDDVERLLRREMRRRPKALILVEEWIDLARRQGLWEETLARCAETRKRFPAAPAGYSIASSVLLGLNRMDEAEALLEQAQRNVPDGLGAAYWDQRASAAQQRNEYEKAAGFLEMALKESPRNKHLYLRVSKALRGLGRDDSAREHLTAALLKFPDDPELLKEMAAVQPPPAQPEPPPTRPAPETVAAKAETSATGA